MSTLIYKTCENISVSNDIQFVVQNKQENLADFVRRIIHEKGLSYRKVADISGGLITHSTVSDVINGRAKNITSQSVAGLARGLGVTEQEIFSLVRGKSADVLLISNERFIEIAFKFAALPKQIQENIEPLIIALEFTIDRAAKQIDFDGKKLATSSRTKIPFDKGVEEKKRKTK